MTHAPAGYPRTISFTVESLEDLDAMKGSLNCACNALGYEVHLELNTFHGVGYDRDGMAAWRSERVERDLVNLQRVLSALWEPRVGRPKGHETGNGEGNG